MSKKGGSKAKTADSGEAKSFKIGDLVLGRIKGYPPWPAKIVDPEKEYLSKEVLKTKPSKKTVHLVKYYDDANYSWSPSNELTALTSKAIETFLNGSKKSGPLLKAYKTAQDPESWEAEQVEHMEKAKNGQLEDDELDSEDEVESKPTADGKRKRKATDKPAKESGDKKKAKVEKKDTKATKAKADKKKTNGDEDMSEGAVKCREWRHKLQKAFLTKGVPDEKDAPTYDGIFKEMEAFEHQAKWLVPSKLPKVVKRIAGIKEDIPREDEFHFKTRAGALVEKWKDSLMPEADMDVDEKKSDEPSAPKETNGDASAAEKENETAEVENKVEAVSIEDEKKEDASAAPEAEAEKSTEAEKSAEAEAQPEVAKEDEEMAASAAE